MGDYRINSNQRSTLHADAAVSILPRIDNKIPTNSYLSTHANDFSVSDSLSLSSVAENVKTKKFVNLDDKYICIECNEVLEDAMQTPCGHRICSPCVKRMLPNGDPVPCPAKEEECVELTTRNVCRDSGARREIRRLLVYCKNKDYGCNVTVQLRQLENHLDICEFKLVQCPNKGCRDQLNQNSLLLHQKECQYGLTSCQICSQQVRRKNLEAHIQEECLEATMKCSNGCGAVPRRYELSSHLESCPMTTAACKFSSMGCNYKGLNEELQSHYVDKLSAHLEYTTVYIAQLELQSVENQRQIQELTTEKQSMKYELNGTKKENEDLQQEISILKKAVRDSKFKMVNLTERCINLERSVGKKAEKLEVERLARDMTVVQGIQTQLLNGDHVESSSLDPTTATQLKAIDKSLGLHDVRLAEMDLRFQILETASYNGELLWKVTDYERRKHEAKTGRTLSLYSQPFYTDRYGYKMCARLYLNGDGIGRGSHMSLYFVVMKSNFDDLLLWPFSKKITMMLLDQDSKANHVVETFYADKNSSSFKKPTNEMNVASGCPIFIVQSRLESPMEPYLKNSTLYIKVLVQDK